MVMFGECCKRFHSLVMLVIFLLLSAAGMDGSGSGIVI